MGVYSGALLKKFNDDRCGKKLYCDVTIEADGITFYGHRFLLGTFSGYFTRIFEGNFSESASKSILVLGPLGSKVSSSVMDVIFSYIYTESVSFTIVNVYDVLLAAEYLDIRQLTSCCVDHLIANVNAETWMETYDIAKSLNLQTLHSACIDDFLHLCSLDTDHLGIDLTELSLCELQAIIQYDYCCSQSTHIYRAILAWIKCDTNERIEHFPQLMKSVDIKSMKRDVTFDRDQFFPEEITSVVPHIIFDVRETLQNRCLLVLGGINPPADQAVAKYDPDSKEFSPCSDLPNPCRSAAVVAHRKKVYVAGGVGNMTHIQVYDVDTDKWLVQEALLQHPRQCAAAAIVDSTLHVIGGNAGTDRYTDSYSDSYSTIEVFDIADDGRVNPAETGMLSFGKARSHHAVVTKNGKHYLLGGFVENDETNYTSCIVMDVKSETTSSLPDMLRKRFGHAAVLFENRIVVLGGGFDGEPTAESYSFATNAWSLFTQPMSTHKDDISACVFDGRIYVVGDEDPDLFLVEDSDDSSDSESEREIYIPSRGGVEYYDANTDTGWCFQQYTDMNRYLSTVVPI